MGVMIDAKTGKFIGGINSLLWDEVGDNFAPIECRLNSKLIVFTGARNEEEDDDESCGD